MSAVAKLSAKRDRRKEVLLAASRLFVANGYMATTMDDIAHAVELNKGTLYYYYASKADILFDILFRAEEGRLELTREKPPGQDPVQALSQFVEETAVYILENPIASQISMQESPFIDMWLTKEQVDALRERHFEFQKYLLGPITAGIDSGVFSGFDARVVTESINGALAWLPRWYRPRGRLSIAEIARQFSQFVLSGLLRRPEDVSASPAAPDVAEERAGPSGAEPNAAPRKDMVARATRRRERAERIHNPDN